MMKHMIFAGAFLLANALAGEAIAACSVGGGWTQVQNLVAEATNNSAALGRTACSSAGQGTQEEHHANGELWDYKLGDGHPVDPRVQVGTWSVANDGTTNAAITYNYFDGGSFGPFKVFINAGVYDFCNASNVSVGTFSYIDTTGTSRVCPP
ncbi:MAG: hypothetical protein CTY16_02285 [Methylobacter sp.]|nr:MAG: hypothetical protein CTY16_02285 [Methylobacter sp.]